MQKSWSSLNLVTTVIKVLGVGFQPIWCPSWWCVMLSKPVILLGVFYTYFAEIACCLVSYCNRCMSCVFYVQCLFPSFYKWGIFVLWISVCSSFRSFIGKLSCQPGQWLCVMCMPEIWEVFILSGPLSSNSLRVNACPCTNCISLLEEGRKDYCMQLCDVETLLSSLVCIISCLTSVVYV